MLYDSCFCQSAMKIISESLADRKVVGCKTATPGVTGKDLGQLHAAAAAAADAEREKKK